LSRIAGTTTPALLDKPTAVAWRGPGFRNVS
jgi:hypothetical protein